MVGSGVLDGLAVDVGEGVGVSVGVRVGVWIAFEGIGMWVDSTSAEVQPDKTQTKISTNSFFIYKVHSKHALRTIFVGLISIPS